MNTAHSKVHTTQWEGSEMSKRKHIAQRRWTPEQRQEFADRVRPRATTFADQRKKQSKEACRNFKWQG